MAHGSQLMADGSSLTRKSSMRPAEGILKYNILNNGTFLVLGYKPI